MKLKNVPRLRPLHRESIFLNDLMWFKGYTPREMEYLAAQNKLVCVCYLANTPITSAIFFHNKLKYYA